jgi:hypothetical protein
VRGHDQMEVCESELPNALDLLYAGDPLQEWSDRGEVSGAYGGAEYERLGGFNTNCGATE